MKALEGTIISSSPTNSTYSQPQEEGNTIHSTSTEGKNDSFPQQHSQGLEANNINLLLQKLNNSSKGKELVAVMHTIQESNSSTQPPLEVQAVPMEGYMAMQIEKGYAPPALTIKLVQGKTWKRAASKVCRLARESETTQVIPSPKHNKRTKEES
ncbi:fatty acid biosynthesis 1 [Striga asiatica]|uniref:Fatty acid biosynthesis 1 n=1 Tax=Striga asiatica TaxID=4170 RepID=A0A5A7PAK1_STRAF|nr:fatty acid biosynthesis 1 [Striga asiatica]